MKKTIEINGISCNFKSSAAVPRIYRLKFGRDIFVDMSRLETDTKSRKNEESTLPIESLEMFENIAYLMHKHGDPSQPEDVMEWLDQFETFDIYEILPEILEMWSIENMQMSHAKKKNGK